MQCYISTSCYPGTLVIDAILRCRELNPDYVEISAPHHYQSLNEFEIILNDLNKEGVNIVLHNYFPPPKTPFILNMASNDNRVISQSEELVMNALNLSLAAGSPIYGIHAGYLYSGVAGSDGMFVWDEDSYSSYNDSLRKSTEFVKRFSKEFNDRRVKLLIENLFPGVKKQASLFCSLSEIKEYMSLVPQSVGLLLDLGHLNISSNLLEFDRDEFLDDYLDEFGSRLYEIHISENDGFRDLHLPPKSNSWQLNALRKIHSIPLQEGSERIYCLEARRATEQELKVSLEIINRIIC